MKNFTKNLLSIPKNNKTVLLRLYNNRDELVSIIPNIQKKQGSVQIFQHIADANGNINFEASKRGINLFGENLQSESSSASSNEIDSFRTGIVGNFF